MLLPFSPIVQACSYLLEFSKNDKIDEKSGNERLQARKNQRKMINSLIRIKKERKNKGRKFAIDITKKVENDSYNEVFENAGVYQKRIENSDRILILIQRVILNSL